MPETRRHGRIEGLDLIRGLAIGLVLLRHAWPSTFGGGGIVGVVMFFALSGYLITGLLLSDIGCFGRVRYGRFYRNRALRLVPALVLMLGVLAVVTLILDPWGDRAGLGRALLIGITYTGNLPIPLGSSGISHLWTLATEEQFYLVWPILLAIGVRFRRMRWVLAVSVLAIATVMIASMLMTAPDITRIYTLPSSWAIAMVIGAAAYVGQDALGRLLPKSGIPRAALSLLSLGILMMITFSPIAKSWHLTYVAIGPLVALLTVVIILHLREWKTLPKRWLKPALALGTISYAAYLWNYPVVLWLSATPAIPHGPLLSLPITLLAATISWWLVERPFLAWKSRLDAQPSVPAQSAPARLKQS
ncbi:acyltransferase [Cryobacterium sp. TMT1-62]|uniref:acyltransferase family protein n=1 Tax=Cryobacterium sp. TMT1-62 TaxID=1259240 RepID=UPI00141AA431|nr:acyltransferase [Cryobacterium sp. TMT1-62]